MLLLRHHDVSKAPVTIPALRSPFPSCPLPRRDAADAVYGRDGYDYYGHRLRVEIARGPRPGGGASRAPGTGYRVTVEGLPSSASWQDLKDFMRSAVMPVFADVKKDRDGRPVGVVEFESADDMDRAIRKLDDTEFTSRFEKGCYVRLYEDRGGRGRGRGRGRRERSRSRSRSPAGGKSNKGARERSVSRSVSRSRSPPRERSGSPAPPQPNDAPAAPPAEAPAAAKDDE